MRTTLAKAGMSERNVDVAGTGFAVLDKVYWSKEPIAQALGGSCGNVLVSLAMLKRAVAPVLALGTDEVGDWLVNEFVNAGADTRYIFRRAEIASPVLAQQFDHESGQHTFSFVCPETAEQFPRFRPIERKDVSEAESAISACAVFYVDRLSPAIVEAMETAAGAGALIYFEPSAIDDWELFRRALDLISFLKFSADQLGEELTSIDLRPGTVQIMTKGTEGLEVRWGDRVAHCDAVAAPWVRDTCGSGDMVSVGVIDWLLSNLEPDANPSEFDRILEGVKAGQRLAAANCAYLGARGLFRQQGGLKIVRSVLDGAMPCDLAWQFELGI